jgi:hypothetical protein
MRCDTAVFDTAIVMKTTQSKFPDLIDVGGVLQSYLSPSLSIYSVQLEFQVPFALWGGMPGDIVLFASALVPQIHKLDKAEIADVGDTLQLSGCLIPAYVYCVSRFA